QPDIIGMSDLLTTTMINMAEVIKELKVAGLRSKVKIMIGRAPVTQNYAEQIGADCYAPDAASAADSAKKFIV
ncbi:MAG: cobalamin-binding protein, partial [Atribacterota bacterium]|nr:cobalamin-binding protein [Atribacterota bacterium]